MIRLLSSFVISSLCLWQAAAVAAPQLTAGTVELNSTWHSISVRWDITGDDDHDASGELFYSEPGGAQKTAFQLVRVDGPGGNYLAGSIMFLQPNTSYTVQASISDPDGGSDVKTFVVDTKRVPQPVTGGPVLHVVPGSGGGKGSAADPYRGLETAWAVAQPGDTLLLHAGYYGSVSDANGSSGQPDWHITIKAAGDGEVVLDYLQITRQSHLWIEGLTFRHNSSAGSDTGLYSSFLNSGYDNGFQPMSTSVTDIIVSRNRFEGYKHSVRAGPRTHGWVIVDNTIVGDKKLGISGTFSFDGEGIELGHGDDHIVAYNSITHVADAISFPGDNCDIFANDIFDVTDDGIEMDGGGPNTRVWYNRIHNVGHNGFSFQPQNSGPWFIVRNQVINYQESGIKFRDTDRFVAVHNTFVNWGELLDHWSGHLLRGLLRNNLWISVDGSAIWRRSENQPDWRTDMDYEGFDWGNSSQPFDVGGTKYADLDALSSATDMHNNSVRIEHSTCFEVFNVPGPAPLTTIPPQWITPASSCAVVDAGQVLPGLNDEFTGAGPDMGVIERGVSPPHIGPRSQTSPSENLPVVSLVASDIDLEYQGSTLLTWTSSNAEACAAAGDWSGDKLLSGSQTVGPLVVDSRFVLVCSNAAGDASRSISVSVAPPTPEPTPTISLSANPTDVSFQDSTTLSWTSEHASECEARGGWSGKKDLKGSESSGPLSTSVTYILVCNGDGGSAIQSVSVNVALPNTDSDSDGLPDAWENDRFGDLITANDSTDTDGDGLTDIQEYENQTNPLDADSDGDGDSDYEEISFGTNPIDHTDGLFVHRPLPPSLTPIADELPASDYSFTVEDFSDPDHNDGLSASHWQVARDQTFTELVADRKLNGDFSEFAPAPGLMDKGQSYWIRTRHRDSSDLWSKWSTPVQFTISTSDINDADNDGVDDQYQVNVPVDTDNNGIEDQSENVCNLTDVNGRALGFRSDAGRIRCFTVVDSKEMPAEMLDGEFLPLGLFGFRIEGLSVNPQNPATVEVDVYLPDPLDTDAVWYNYDVTARSFVTFPGTVVIQGSVATITLVDGGAGDADGVVNGVIVDPSGPVTGAARSAPVQASGGGGAVGPYALLMLVLIALIAKAISEKHPALTGNNGFFHKDQ